MSTKNWLALIGLTCAAFIFNTSEFIPIGLLTDIATAFSTTESRVGMIISVYAFVVMLLSLPLMIVVSRFEMKKLLVSVIFVFMVFQLLSAASSSYNMLMMSRIGVACAHSIFWSIVSPLAVRIVPEKYRALALSMIVTGTSVAMIFGLPIGRIIGLYIGWRMTFFCIGVFAFALMVYLLLMLPKVPSRGTFSLRKLPILFKRPLLVGIFILAFAIATSYYTGYSYIEPFLKQVACLQDSWITATLVIFGAMGILGSIAFSKFYNKNPYRFFGVVLLSIFGLPHATSGSCLLWRDNHSVVRPMGYGIYSLERSIAGRNDKQFPGRSHSSVNVYLFRPYQPGNSMWHLYRRSGMHTPLHLGHRLCGSRTGLVDFCLLEQDCQKENERNVCFSLMHDWACSLLSGPVSKFVLGLEKM